MAHGSETVINLAAIPGAIVGALALALLCLGLATGQHPW